MSFRIARLRALTGVTLSVVTCLGSLSSVARAEGRARVLFEEGRQLAKLGRYAEACPKLVQSFQLEIATGTEFNLADCLEHLGERERARTLFIDVVQKSLDAGHNERAAMAHDRAAALASAPPAETPAPPKVEPVPELVIEAQKPELAERLEPDARSQQVVAARAKLRDEAGLLAEATAELRTLRATIELLVRREPDEGRARAAQLKLVALGQQLDAAWELAARVEALATRSERWLAVGKQPGGVQRAATPKRHEDDVASTVPFVANPHSESASAASR